MNPSNGACEDASLHTSGSSTEGWFVWSGWRRLEAFRLHVRPRAWGVGGGGGPPGLAGVIPMRLRPGSAPASCSTVSDGRGGGPAVLLLARRRVYRTVSPLDDCA